MYHRYVTQNLPHQTLGSFHNARQLRVRHPNWRCAGDAHQSQLQGENCGEEEKVRRQVANSLTDQRILGLTEHKQLAVQMWIT